MEEKLIRNEDKDQKQNMSIDLKNVASRESLKVWNIETKECISFGHFS